MAEPHLTVLGANGFIGRHLSSRLAETNVAFLAPARDDKSWLQKSLGDVIYSIGLTADFRSRPFETIEAHVGLLQDLLQIGNFRSLTYISSTRVYSGSRSTSEDSYLQVNPCEPSDLYNLSKLMGESLVLNCGRPCMKIARLSNVIGSRPDPDIFIDQLLEEGFSNGKIQLQTSLESKKDYLHISDAVDMLIRIAISKTEGIFNVASGEAVSNRHVIDLIKEELGFCVTVMSKAPVWEFQPIDTSKIRKVFDFNPQKFEQYFPQFLRNYAKYKKSSSV